MEDMIAVKETFLVRDQIVEDSRHHLVVEVASTISKDSDPSSLNCGEISLHRGNHLESDVFLTFRSPCPRREYPAYGDFLDPCVRTATPPLARCCSDSDEKLIERLRTIYRTSQTQISIPSIPTTCTDWEGGLHSVAVDLFIRRDLKISQSSGVCLSLGACEKQGEVRSRS